MKKNKLFLIFLFITSCVFLFSGMFIQTSYFNNIIKRIFAQSVPRDLGVSGDFQDIRVKIFPPGVEIRSGNLKLENENFLELPPGSEVTADSIVFQFEMFQMFTGKVLVDKVLIYKGKVLLDLDFNFFKEKKKEKEKSSPLSWDELVNIKINSVVLTETHFSGKFKNPDAKFEFYSNEFILRKGKTSKDLYYLKGDLTSLTSETPKAWMLPNKIDSLKIDAVLGNQGVYVKNIQYENNSIQLGLSGNVYGDILRQSQFKFDAQFTGSGELTDIFNIHKIPLKSENIKGNINFEGKISGPSADIIKNLKGSFRAQVNQFQLERWNFDKTELQLDFDSLEKIEIKKLELTSPLVEREGNFQPGSGGVIKVAPFEFNPFSDGKLDTMVSLENAHIHWLGAGIVEKVYLLDHRINGKIKIEASSLFKKNDFQVKLTPAITVPHFILDNQRLHKNRKRRKLLDLNEIAISGEISIDSKKVDFKNTTIQVHESQLKTQGYIDYKTGIHLKSEGFVDLKEVGQLSEIDIAGSGQLKVLVEGPLNAVKLHFDLNGKNLEYINLKFGDIQGRVTWDDGQDNLYITKAKAIKNLTHYEADGVIRLKDKEEIDIDFNILDGNIFDLSSVFENITAPISWYPRALTGDCAGTVKVSGGLDLDQLVIFTKLNGKNWDYFKERFTNVSLEGGFTKGTYYLSKIDLLKYRGRLTGQVSYHEKTGIDWNLESSFISLSDIDFFASLDVPMRGALSFKSQGKGQVNQLTSNTRVYLSQFNVLGKSYGESQLNLNISNQYLTLESSIHSGSGQVQIKHALKQGADSNFSVELKDFGFSPLLLILNPSLMTDTQLNATADGNVKLNYKTGSFKELNGLVAIKKVEIQKQGLSYKLFQPVEYVLKNGSHPPVQFDIFGREKKFSLQVSSQRSEMNGEIKGEMDLGLLEFILQPVELSTGTAHLDMKVAGTLEAPRISGRGKISDTNLKIKGFENSFESINGHFTYKDRKLNFVQIDGIVGGGPIHANGILSFERAGFPGLDLTAKLTKSNLKFFPFSSSKMRGELSVVGVEPPYVVSGNILLEEALIREKISGLSADSGLKVARFSPPISSQDSSYSPFKLDIKVLANKGVWVKNELFDAELKGEITVVNTLTIPRLLGRLDVIQGRLLFKDYNFRIESGSLEFDNATTMDPLFNMNSSSLIKNYNINLVAKGRPSKWAIDLNSNPSLQESEILSLLALGFTSDDLQKVNSADRDVLQQGSAASLLLHSLEFNQEVKSKTGLEIKLDESVNSQKRTSVFRSRSQIGEDAASEAAPRVSVSRKVGKNLDVSVGSTIGAGTRSEQEVNAAYSLTPGLKIIGVLNNSEGVNTQDTQTSYGVDIKVQKRFK